MVEKLYKVSEVARLFEVTPATVRIWLRTGEIEGVKIGKGYVWRVPASEVERVATSRWGNESQHE